MIECQSGRPNIWFTTGPATSDPKIRQQMFSAGADGARLTFSFRDAKYQSQISQELRLAAKTVGKSCYVVADLAGEKVRLGNFAPDHMAVTAGQELILMSHGGASPEKFIFPVTSELFVTEVIVGDKIYVGDGSLELEVVAKHTDRLLCLALTSGMLNPNRGVIAQSQTFQPGCLTDRDRADLVYITGHEDDFDAVALSFVGSAHDVEQARNILGTAKRRLPIIAKIETGKGVENIAAIAEAADAIMVARGDLALFLPWEELGNNVDEIVSVANKVGRPWIMATQIAEGMERFVFPTRPEICDLTHWVRRGMGTVMFSYETAFGSRPVEVVRYISKILQVAKKEGMHTLATSIN